MSKSEHCGWMLMKSANQGQDVGLLRCTRLPPNGTAADNSCFTSNQEVKRDKDQAIRCHKTTSSFLLAHKHSRGNPYWLKDKSVTTIPLKSSGLCKWLCHGRKQLAQTVFDVLYWELLWLEKLREKYSRGSNFQRTAAIASPFNCDVHLKANKNHYTSGFSTIFQLRPHTLRFDTKFLLSGGILNFFVNYYMLQTTGTIANLVDVNLSLFNLPTSLLYHYLQLSLKVTPSCASKQALPVH